jgi:Helicase conserved C-terminal domain
MTSVEVRSRLVDALRLDLVGPSEDLGDPIEILPQAPSSWYLTGFLVPAGAVQTQGVDEASTDEVDQAGNGNGLDDDVAPEPAPARQRYLPSSIGLSVLVPSKAGQLAVKVSWGDYRLQSEGQGQGTWQRAGRTETVTIDLAKASAKAKGMDVPESRGLQVVFLARPVGNVDAETGLPSGAHIVSVFLVNRCTPAPDDTKDQAFAFQVEIELTSETGFLPRPNLRGLASNDWDERLADLQYRDVGDYAVGHNVATRAFVVGGVCSRVQTLWIPEAEVEYVAWKEIPGAETSMDALSRLADFPEASAKLSPIVKEYRSWIEAQAANIPDKPKKRRETGLELLNRARVAADRIQRGIELLADPTCLEAFRLANKVMAASGRRRFGAIQGKPAESVQPAWRPFQLAFLLMNLAGIAQQENKDREVVDLLFFPTGGGKTEAYLGLAAFTLILRRLKNSGIGSAGVSVLMRYTLRLLTLDQLSRASTLICALELERQQGVTKLGDWPFEIGLWVGRAATPNRMGRKGDNDPESARLRTLRFMNDDRRPSPVPLEECPWCGTKFKGVSFRLVPNSDAPEDLRISCVNRECPFSRGVNLPIVAVDEPIYRRLPCFVIATVDKFAALPWTGPVGGFFGRVQRYDKAGFYGPCDPGRGTKLPQAPLLPPDLIVQDELHLISGPLGTMVGLYETALDELCVVQRDAHEIRPKIVASTATVRRAETQIRALFNRRMTDVFPPPGPDRRDSFFARTVPTSESSARLYVGVAAQGRSPKVAMLRVYLALLGAGQKWYSRLREAGMQANLADPYMTLVGYFNSLRELGGARRVIEDEVRNRLSKYSSRKRVGEAEGLFDDRQIGYEPVELTSRVSTAEVAEARRRLGLSYQDKQRVDVAIATNMISVGIDITRLGLMVVFGQPKTSAEYIQATSRVGRDPALPGLVITIYNVHKPRDRSHYERFAAYHESFYRSVEATSVTPFSPRALDKGLAATLVGLIRQGHQPMTPPLGAVEVLNERARLEFAIRALDERAYGHSELPVEEAERIRQRVRERVQDLLDEWAKVAQEYRQVGTGLQYNPVETGGAKQLLYDFLSPEVRNLPPTHARMKFRAGRSLRDVEPNVNVWVRTLEDRELEEDSP